MTVNSNQLAFSTLTHDYPIVAIPNATAATETKVTEGLAGKASVITDVLFRSADASNRIFEIIICPTGQQTNALYRICQVTVNAGVGNNGTSTMFSLANFMPMLFDIDLAGNRVITLEPGTELWVRNTTTLGGEIKVMAKRRNF